jgi:adenylosuccinate synthase
MLANGIVSPALEKVCMGHGSQLDLKLLYDEICGSLPLMAGKTIFIHRNASVIQQSHRDQEKKTMVGIGSTMKGCGAALTEKIQRKRDGLITIGQLCEVEDSTVSDFLNGCAEVGVNVQVVDNMQYLAAVVSSRLIQIEGVQGYSLGIGSGFYPYTTSRECTPAQILSDTGVPPYLLTKIIGSIRTFPIRVANRYDEKGEMVGYSGDGYPDQKEITFEELGLKTEYTTVTKLPRRIFTFSIQQMAEFMVACQPSELFLNFANYLESEDELVGLIQAIESIAVSNGLATRVKYLGFGATESDVLEKADKKRMVFRGDSK